MVLYFRKISPEFELILPSLNIINSQNISKLKTPHSSFKVRSFNRFPARHLASSFTSALHPITITNNHLAVGEQNANKRVIFFLSF
jgi:hypothetical protein